MDAAMLLQYGWVLIVLIGLEGILAADNAVVMAVMVKHLEPEQQKKALFYGLVGALVFRFIALFLIATLAKYWQLQALGAVYLLYIAGSNLYKKFAHKEGEHKTKKRKQGGFWATVIKVEVADIAFAVDSMLAAVALAITLPPSGWGHIAEIDTAQFIVMFLGGVIGLIIIRFVATAVVNLLKKYPALETGAFVLVGWVGVKLVVMTLAHEKVALLDAHFPHGTVWQSIFYGVMVLIIVISVIVSRKAKETTV
ncbi:TerC family protein [Brochothrix campestris]|uniref:TerC family membrane protein n=1 Tax=Brochothrix campestris FSL F6-1037 TaxID=1265861 RepID=W7CTU2_9LIST|nr:TerC family protein [Brochothrix campestris]EUJ39251.1 TerC family membrane protein [Brochothrix campestris FSL F6-1037]